MTRSDIHLTGMPYVPGMAHGVLQRSYILRSGRAHRHAEHAGDVAFWPE